jgi:hypothetical protein
MSVQPVQVIEAHPRVGFFSSKEKGLNQMNTSVTQGNYLSEKQVQAEFDIPHNSLRMGRATGILWSKPAPAYIKIGRKCLYKRETISAWFTQFTEVSNTAQARMASQ